MQVKPRHLPRYEVAASRPERQRARAELAAIVKKVRLHFPQTPVAKAWVHTVDGKNWEFHCIDKYFERVQATNALAARAKGWVGWLKAKGIR